MTPQEIDNILEIIAQAVRIGADNIKEKSPASALALIELDLQLSQKRIELLTAHRNQMEEELKNLL